MIIVIVSIVILIVQIFLNVLSQNFIISHGTSNGYFVVDLNKINEYWAVFFSVHPQDETSQQQLRWEILLKLLIIAQTTIFETVLNRLVRDIFPWFMRVSSKIEQSRHDFFALSILKFLNFCMTPTPSRTPLLFSSMAQIIMVYSYRSAVRFCVSVSSSYSDSRARNASIELFSFVGIEDIFGSYKEIELFFPFIVNTFSDTNTFISDRKFCGSC